MADSESVTQDKILAFLATRAGSMADPTGRGLTAELAQAIGYDRPAGLSVVLGRMESEGVITRDVRGLRTYRIALTDYQPPAAAAPAAPAPAPPARRSLADPVAAAPVGNGAGSTVDWRALAEEGHQSNGSAGRQVGRANGTGAARARTDPVAPPPSPDSESWRDIEPAATGPVGPRRKPGYGAPSDLFSALASAPPVDDYRDDRVDDRPSFRPQVEDRSTSTRKHWWSIELPHLSGAPSNTVLAIVGVTMTILVITTLVAAFVSHSSAPSSNVADNSNSTIDSCTLITPQEVSVAFGGDANAPHLVLGACVFDNGRHQLIVDAADNRAKARFDAARGDSAQDVPGIGDAAYYENGRLGVLKGSRMVLMTLVPYSTAAPSTAAITLARAAASRL